MIIAQKRSHTIASRSPARNALVGLVVMELKNFETTRKKVIRERRNSFIKNVKYSNNFYNKDCIWINNETETTETILFAIFSCVAFSSFFFNSTEIGIASGSDGSVQPHGKAILIKLKSTLWESGTYFLICISTAGHKDAVLPSTHFQLEHVCKSKLRDFLRSLHLFFFACNPINMNYIE